MSFHRGAGHGNGGRREIWKALARRTDIEPLRRRNHGWSWRPRRRGPGVGGRRGDVGGICPGFSNIGFPDRGFSPVRGRVAGCGRLRQREAANVQQTVVNAVNAPAQALLGRPLIGPETVGSSAAAVSFGFGPILAGSDRCWPCHFSYPACPPHSVQ